MTAVHIDGKRYLYNRFGLLLIEELPGLFIGEGIVLRKGYIGLGGIPWVGTAPYVPPTLVTKAEAAVSQRRGRKTVGPRD